MGLYERANNIVKANLQEVADTGARAGTEGLKESILNLEATRRGLRFELTTLDKETRAHTRERAQAEAELTKWERLLEVAQAGGRPDLAAQAQARVAEHRHHVAEFVEQEQSRKQKRQLLQRRLEQIDQTIAQLRRGGIGLAPPRLRTGEPAPPAAESIDPLEAQILALQTQPPPPPPE